MGSLGPVTQFSVTWTRGLSLSLAQATTLPRLPARDGAYLW